jgi:uncharacterized protein (TIGR02099 family)
VILRHAKRAHVGIGYLAAATVIAIALLLGVISQAMAWLARNPARVDAWLEHRVGQPVAFSAMHTRWTRRGPLIEMEDLRIGDGADAFRIGDAQLLASIYSGVLPGRSFSELRLGGLDMTLVRQADGKWKVQGLPGQESPGGDPFAALERLGELHVTRGSLRVQAPAYGIDARIPRVDVRLRVDGDRVRAGARAWPAEGERPVDGVIDFDRRSGDGRVYTGARDVALSRWAGLLHGAGARVAGGRGSLRAWAELRGHRIAGASAEGDLRGLVVQGAPLDGRRPRLVFDRVDLLGDWRHADGQWQARMPRLRLVQAGTQQTLDGLAVAGGGRFTLAAERVDIAPLVQALALTDRIAPAARRWLRSATPVGMVERIRVEAGAGGAPRVEARVASVGFTRVGGTPGLRGVSGRIAGDTDGLHIEFDPASPVVFSWPQAFGRDHVVRLSGSTGLWRDGAGWSVGTHALAIDGAGYDADVRGGLRWQGDGTRPWIDLAAAIHPAQVPVAKRFWVRHVMPPVVVKWLDEALVGGTVRNGRAIVTGDLDDWPFEHGEGRFEARADIAGATLRFQPDWPVAEGVDARVAFIGNGFSLDGRGRVGGVALSRLRACIDDYRKGALTVEAAARTDARELLEVLRRSPLQAQQPETFAALGASGPADVEFGLLMPLGRGLPMRIEGAVDLDGARLSDSRWNLSFDGVRGRARYDRQGFTASDLSVRHDGQSGRLALRAGPGHVRQAANAFEGAVDATFDIDELLQRAPEMAWLAPHVDGRSGWSVGVVVPRAAPAGAPAARLQLRSTLAGTSLDLPAPLRKSASQPLATFVDTPLPLGSGEISVSLGNLLGVRARSAQGRTGVRVQLGSGRVDEAPPVEGLVAAGRATQLDALDWIAFATGGTDSGSTPGAGLRLQRVDVSTGRLMMLGGQFGESRLQLQPAAGGATSVRVDGPSLSGSLAIPAGGGAIIGRFPRVHWKPAEGGSAGVPAARPSSLPRGVAAARAAPATLDPASIPALSIDVDDLRLGEARLGDARLRSRPTPSGMRLDQFTARGRAHRLDASGEWTGRGAASHTRLHASVTSDDFGTLLAGLGLSGRVAGGKGDASLEAAWPGSPAEFAIGGLEGTLAVNARDGRLLEVEPGAGRVLGLLSLAELPRRLTLDFRDFFSKGFAFNRLRGNVRFGGGEARSDDLAIRGPAADIDIRGIADLRRQTFDQTVEVRPKSGNLLTAVGALAGGPVGAAIGAAANAVLKKPLGQIGAKTYRVTGPWKEPKVEVMSREQSRARVAARPAG